MAELTTKPIIETRGLTKHFQVKAGAFAPIETLRAVQDVSFAVGRDTVYSIVGESGCGKSTVARLILKLIEPTSGEVLFNGASVVGMDAVQIKAFRRAVQIVFQDPFASLNPRRTVFETLSEPLVIHGLASKGELQDRVARLLLKVGLEDIMDRYPHEFSGGQRQRICIARALAVGPQVIVADEPLSALDVSIQAQMINLLQELRRTEGMSYVFISHDLRVVRHISDTVGVMYLGRLVEVAPSEGLFEEPLHPYTQLLLSSAPMLRAGAAALRAVVPTGEVPSPLNVPAGCPFHPRCPRRFAPCDMRAPELLDKGTRSVACHLYT